MKVIDLLNKIANNEEVPEKIKFKDIIYELKERNYHYYSYKDSEGTLFEDDWFLSSILNDEIEIIEDTPKEDKKITKLNTNYQYSFSEELEKETIYVICKKINEIIDRLNGEDNVSHKDSELN